MDVCCLTFLQKMTVVQTQVLYYWFLTAAVKKQLLDADDRAAHPCLASMFALHPASFGQDLDVF